MSAPCFCDYATIGVSGPAQRDIWIEPFVAPDYQNDLELRYKHARGVAEDEIPDKWAGHTSAEPVLPLPHFCSFGFWLISARAADVFSRHDLSGGRIQPIQVYQHDRVTPVAGQTFILVPGLDHKTFDAAQSILREDEFSPGVYLPSWSPKDEEIVVPETGLPDSDLWVDSRLRGVFFVSARLAGALNEAGVAEPFDLIQTRLI